MNDSELNECLDALGERWPEWEANSTIIGDWRFALRPYSRETALAAIREHRIEYAWKEPKLKNVRDLCEAKEPRRRSGRPTPQKHDIWIKCVEDGQQIKAGYMTQLITACPCSPDRALDIAHENKQKYTACYGGAWQVIQGDFAKSI